MILRLRLASTRSLFNKLPYSTASTSSLINDLHPRKLSELLDRYVVGQSKAKKTLSVGVYNHYTKLQKLYPPGPELSVDDELERLGSVPEQHQQPLVRPRPRSATVAASSGVTSPPPSKGRGMFDKSTTAEDPDPNLLSDPTLYDSPLVHNPLSPSTSPPTPTRRRKSIHANDPPPSPSIIDSNSSEILSDFIGQTTGTSPSPRSHPPPPTPPAPKRPNFYEKSNILLLGPTGTGKSLLARTLATSLQVPFVTCEATSLTMAGYVGEDVETCIERLLVEADWDTTKAGRGIVFIDEVDKIARFGGGVSGAGRTSAGGGKDVGGEGVQQGLLKILEGTIVSVPDKSEDGSGARRGKANRGDKEAYLVDTTNVLFILSGAFVGLESIITSRLEKSSIGFGARLPPPSSLATTTSSHPLEHLEPSDLIQFGFIPEFIGRLPILATLHPLSVSDLLRVLTEPKNALVKQYTDLFDQSGVELRFTKKALEEVARKGLLMRSGARGLRNVLEKVLLDAMYDAPQSSIRYVLCNENVVKGVTPALYYSRGQRHLFANAFEAEEGFGEEIGEIENEGREREKKRATA